MDTDELERITSIRTERQKKYPPYLMSQLRWALHCYRWRENLKWSKYPGVICAKLGFELAVYDDEDENQKKERDKNILDFQKGTTKPNDAKKTPSPINAKDPMIWILKGKEPVKEKKIQAYIDFLKIEAPEYIDSLNDEDFTHKVSDFFYKYYAHQLDEEKFEKLSDQARYIEKHIFITNESENGELSQKDAGILQNKLAQYDLEKECLVKNRSNIFESKDTVIGFRQLGATPFLNFFIFGIDSLDGVDFRDRKKKESSDIIKNHFSRIKKSQEPCLKFKHLYTGILCPSIREGSYIGIAKNKSRDCASINLTFLKSIDQNIEKNLHAFEREGCDLSCEILFDYHPTGLSRMHRMQIRSSILLNAYQVDFLQNFITNIKP